MDNSRPSRNLKKPSRVSKSDSNAGGSSGEKQSRTSCDSILNRVFQIDLTKFCSRKLFNVFLVNESSDASALLLEDLINISKEYEEISSLVFITRENVLNLIVEAASGDVLYPNQLKPLLLSVIESIGSTKILTSVQESQLVKLKIIQVMYHQYVTVVKLNEKEKNLDTLLNTLTKECRKKQKKDEAGLDEKNKVKEETKNAKDDTKNANKKPNKNDDANLKTNGKYEENDYSSVPLERDGITYEENIFNYINFYCLTGFTNVEIIKTLIGQVNVPVSGIIKVSCGETEYIDRKHEEYWKAIGQLFFGNTSKCSVLENTILLQFKPSQPDLPIVNSLEDFLQMLRMIVNVKLTYLNYLRHLELNKIRHLYRVADLDCLTHYTKSLRHIPPECITTELILNAVIQEVCHNVESEPVTTTSLRSITYSRSSHMSLHCADPLRDINAFATSNGSQTKKFQTDEGFLVHENNTIDKILKSYKYVGPKIADIILDMLKRIPLYNDLDINKVLITFPADITHFHDLDPSMESVEVENRQGLENFLYIFLFNIITSGQKETLTWPSSYLLTPHLMTFSAELNWKDAQPNVNELFVDGPNDVSEENNYYDTSVVHFRWKENLNHSLLLQEVHSASNEYLYVDKKYSPETDNLLVVFSDRLDEFGINVKLYDVTVRTPICFRDFCRYSVIEDNEWLQENEVKIAENTFKVVFDEICPGAQKVKKHYKIFQEYSYLLDGDIKEGDEDEYSDRVNSEQDQSDQEEVMVNTAEVIKFEDILTNLESMPANHSDVIKECVGKGLLAYDLSSNVFKITGKVTTFCSHDSVKVTVDNTRLLQQPEKCTFKVTSDGDVLTVHSSENLFVLPYTSTLRLEDDTRISLIVCKPNVSRHQRHGPKDSTFNGKGKEVEIGNTVYNSPNVEEIFNAQSKVQEADKAKPQFVHCVDEECIKSLLPEGKSLGDLSVNGNYQDLLEAITNAKDNNGKIYKVNAKTNYLKRKTVDLKVPLQTALQDILSMEDLVLKPAPKEYEIFTKRFEPDSEVGKSDLDVNLSVDFRICLPNGLYIRPHSCLIDRRFLIIKQEYADEKPNIPQIQHEEFRLFSNQGFVVIKKIDGSITMLKATGDIITFEKPNDGFGESASLKPCHCATFEDYRNKLNKILKDLEDSDFSISRRAHITSKQSHIIDGKILKVLEEFDVPYIKKSIVRFDGKKIKIQGNKITQKQLHYMVSQQDYDTGEIHFDRSDNFRSMFKKTGSQKVIFPDGTVISNSIDVAEELVDDFVFVILSFEYEHPYYASVKYNFDKTSEITLYNNVVLSQEAGQQEIFKVKMKDGVSVSLSSDSLNFRKTCASCSGQFSADFDMKAVRDGCWKPGNVFMRVKDSYEKEFTSDAVGNCSRNSVYIKTQTNLLKCNHPLKTQYKKMFVIERGLNGVMLHSNDAVKGKMREFQSLPDRSAESYSMISNDGLLTTDCRRKFFTKFSERFFFSIADGQSAININQEQEVYETFRQFHKMFDSADEITTYVSDLWEVFFYEFLDRSGFSSIYENLTNLANSLDDYCRKNQQEILTEARESSELKKKQLEDVEKKRRQSMRCCCIRQRMTVEEKMLQWRQICNTYKGRIRKKEIPAYFKSQFCKIQN